MVCGEIQVGEEQTNGTDAQRRKKMGEQGETEGGCVTSSEIQCMNTYRCVEESGECVLCEKFLDEKSFSWMKKVSVGTQCVTVFVCVFGWTSRQKLLRAYQ